MKINFPYPAVFAVIGLFLFLSSHPSITYSHETRLIIDYSLPKKLSLCGEPMPLDDFRVREMLDREFIISVFDQAQVILWLKRSGRFFPYIESSLAEAGMPDDLKYLAVAESALITSIRSNRGAMGPWQFMSRTARRNGLRRGRMIDERRDFERSTEAALKYLKRLKEKFGRWTLALAAYNCGDDRLKKAIKEQKTRDYYKLNLPLETERFVFRIAAIKIIMDNPERYGYSLRAASIYRPINWERVKVKNNRRIHLTDFALSLGTNFKTLKETNPHFRGAFLPTGKFVLKVPPGSADKAKAVLKKFARTSPPLWGEVVDGYYIVRPGDTLSHISKRTGVPIGTLRSLNGIKGSFIRSGQKLKLVSD